MRAVKPRRDSRRSVMRLDLGHVDVPDGLPESWHPKSSRMAPGHPFVIPNSFDSRLESLGESWCPRNWCEFFSARQDAQSGSRRDTLRMTASRLPRERFSPLTAGRPPQLTQSANSGLTSALQCGHCASFVIDTRLSRRPACGPARPRAFKGRVSARFQRGDRKAVVLGAKALCRAGNIHALQTSGGFVLPV
jgi:hypothetical protein